MSVLPTSKGHAFVAYSLGNFISNQRTAPRERGAVVAVDFEKLPEGGVKLSRVSVAPIYVWSDCGKGKASCHIQLVYGGGDIPDEIEKNQKSEETIEATTVERSLFFYEDANPYLTKNQDIIDASYTLTEVESITDSDKVLLAEENPKLKADKGKNTKNNDKNSNNDDNAKKEQDIEVFTLSAKELKRIADISKNILEFLGASLEQDNGGFYTLWYSKEPDKLPVGTRKAPN
jgi:hypothetical protein